MNLKQFSVLCLGLIIGGVVGCFRPFTSLTIAFLSGIMFKLLSYWGPWGFLWLDSVLDTIYHMDLFTEFFIVIIWKTMSMCYEIGWIIFIISTIFCIKSYCKRVKEKKKCIKNNKKKMTKFFGKFIKNLFCHKENEHVVTGIIIVIVVIVCLILSYLIGLPLQIFLFMCVYKSGDGIVNAIILLILFGFMSTVIGAFILFIIGLIVFGVYGVLVVMCIWIRGTYTITKVDNEHGQYTELDLEGDSNVNVNVNLTK